MADTIVVSGNTKIECTVKKVYFTNAVDGLHVLRCYREDTSEYFKAVGYMPSVTLETMYLLEGRWEDSKKHGLQFTFDLYEEIFEKNEEGIVGFLSGCKGIGSVYAEKIFKKFGMDTIEIIETEPDRLLEVSGIGPGRLAKLKANWEERRGVKNIMVFFHSYGITSGQAVRIYKQYGDKSISTVKENPYRLVDDIWGFGFKTVDSIALKMGFDPEGYERLRCGIMYQLDELCAEGHCFILRHKLVSSSTELLNIESSFVKDALDRLVKNKDVVSEDHAVMTNGTYLYSTVVYPYSLYCAEKGVARRLLEIRTGSSGRKVDDTRLLESVQEKLGVRYAPAQLQALKMAVNEKFMVLTGGPGTGKTKTVEGILAAFHHIRATVLLAAPTGRAAKRLAETTKAPAFTIHRLLGVKNLEQRTFRHNEKEPLKGDVLIVDECSMIDVQLMYSLLKAVPAHMVVILVGDVDQLPSVGPGNVLRDIIDSCCFPVVRLTQVFRQAESSGIVMNAHRINDGILPVVSSSVYQDFFFVDMDFVMAKDGIQEYDSSAIAQRASREIVDLVSERLPGYLRKHKMNIRPSDIQVLAPMRKVSDVCVNNLNHLLQDRLNPGKGIVSGGFDFRVDDRVMQKRNNYDKGVFNGDIGVVTSINEEDEILTVLFEEVSQNGKLEYLKVDYDFSELIELELAYATTIHKSQGSEYPVVVIPVLTSNWIMLQRNLIYTGITRAKQCLVLVGTKKALERAVYNTNVRRRFTLLKERIREQRFV